MPVQIKHGFKQMLAEAMSEVEELSAEDMAEALNQPGAVIIDIRDQNELVDSGTLPGAHHASRGMLEFLADPSSPKHQKIFAEADRLILYCATGGRSALAASMLQRMGFENVSHLGGGFKAWVEANQPVDLFTPPSKA